MAKKVYVTQPARLDADRSAKPLSRIISHTHPNWCQGPGINLPEEYRDESGNHIPLKSPPLTYKVNDRVIHNYPGGHGLGTVIDVVPGRTLYRDDHVCPYTVRWDNGVRDIYSERDLKPRGS